jgi:hypothetical protein
MGEADEALLFLDEFFTEEEEKEKLAQNQSKKVAQQKPQEQMKSQNEGMSAHSKNLPKDIIGVILSSFAWSEKKPNAYPASIVHRSADSRSIFVKEDDYFFRTFYGDTPFNEGIHYWEIVADARTEHELKIGVSKGLECDPRTAFCD